MTTTAVETTHAHTVLVHNTLMGCIYGAACDGINHWYRPL